jgi:hypothetical protein
MDDDKKFWTNKKFWANKRLFDLLTFGILLSFGLVIFGCVAPQYGQANQTIITGNQTNITNITTVTTKANLSALNESDFIVVDDAIPTFIISEVVSPLPTTNKT